MTPDEVQLQKAEAQLAETLSRKIESQRKQAWIVFGIGTFVLFVTVLLPVVGAIAPLFGWGCKEVVIAGVKELLCAKIEAPWGFNHAGRLSLPWSRQPLACRHGRKVVRGALRECPHLGLLPLERLRAGPAGGSGNRIEAG